MKQKANHIVILFMAVAIFFVGAGVTIVELCCSGCADNLISMTESATDCIKQGKAEIQDDCCMAEVQNADAACDTHHAEKEDCCKRERVSIDLDNTIYKHSLSSSFVWAFVSLFHSNSLPISTGERYVDPNVTDQVTIPPRDYLSLIRILII